MAIIQLTQFNSCSEFQGAGANLHSFDTKGGSDCLFKLVLMQFCGQLIQAAALPWLWDNCYSSQPLARSSSRHWQALARAKFLTPGIVSFPLLQW